MAQFDVYLNPSEQTRNTYPFILDIQNELIAGIATRIVVPLGNAANFSGEEMKGLTPRISFEGAELLIMIPQIASMPARLLNEPIGTLQSMHDEIIAALDFAITGI